MSHEVDECYDVYREDCRRAAKEHRCSACGETIREGDRYFSVAIVWNGSAKGIRRCARCQAIHLHLRTLAPGDAWPDERLDCGQEYAVHWGREPPEDIAALAFATADEAQASVRPKP